MSATTTSPFSAVALSGHLDTRTAATEAADMLHAQIGATCDLAFVFGSFHHRAAFADAVSIVRQTIQPTSILGVTAESVLCGDEERQGAAGLTAMALRLPEGATLHPWRASPEIPLNLDEHESVRERLGLPTTENEDHNAPFSFAQTVLLLADPFSIPMEKFLEVTNGEKDGNHGSYVPVLGGMASGASQPGHNVLVSNDDISHAGAVGVTVGGRVDVSCLLSPGCRPIGTPLVITKCQGNVILELAGRKAIEVMQEIANELSDEEKQLLSRGLFIGRVINEYKDHFGRGDFLIRNVMGVDQKGGGMAIADQPRAGQTVQLQVRDATTAFEDFQLLLDGEQAKPPPFAGLLISCNSRGARLFGQPNREVQMIRERLGDIPLAGFFAGGEIGPVGNHTFLHGHTALLILFREWSGPGIG